MPTVAPPTAETAATLCFAPSRDRAAALADMRRALTLGDLCLDVAVAHTKQRLRARFCVRLWWSMHPRGVWAFGIDVRAAKQFATELRQLAKKTHAGDAKCAMCEKLRHELHQWRSNFPAFSSLGKRHAEAKCAMLSQFFARVFRVLAHHAAWLQSCELLRELLLRTETLCRVPCDDADRATTRVLASLKRITPVIRSPTRDLTIPDGATECSICLGSVLEPIETSLQSETIHTRLQPTQGLELPCGHRFHDACISFWFLTRLNCPVCRQPASSQ
jgi:hypothetical protein